MEDIELLRHPQLVYFIYAPEVERFKIGYTKQLGRRLTALQTASPVSLECLDAIPAGIDCEEAKIVESACWAAAAELGYKRLHGEWFDGVLALENVQEIITAAALEVQAVLSAKHVKNELERNPNFNPELGF
jgi:hypothetical protein